MTMRIGCTTSNATGNSSATDWGETVKHRQDVLVKCPYYKFEERQMIFCEGVQDGTAIHLAFDTSPNLKDYKNRFCKRCWGECILAQMQNRKWDYDVE